MAEQGGVQKQGETARFKFYRPSEKEMDKSDNLK
jgi:hypothetical protein